MQVKEFKMMYDENKQRPRGNFKINIFKKIPTDTKNLLKYFSKFYFNVFSENIFSLLHFIYFSLLKYFSFYFIIFKSNITTNITRCLEQKQNVFFLFFSYLLLFIINVL